jgi:hypothetical protein
MRRTKDKIAQYAAFTVLAAAVITLVLLGLWL